MSYVNYRYLVRGWQSFSVLLMALTGLLGVNQYRLIKEVSSSKQRVYVVSSSGTVVAEGKDDTLLEMEALAFGKHCARMLFSNNLKTNWAELGKCFSAEAQEQVVAQFFRTELAQRLGSEKYLFASRLKLGEVWFEEGASIIHVPYELEVDGGDGEVRRAKARASGVMQLTVRRRGHDFRRLVNLYGLEVLAFVAAGEQKR